MNLGGEGSCSPPTTFTTSTMPTKPTIVTKTTMQARRHGEPFGAVPPKNHCLCPPKQGLCPPQKNNRPVLRADILRLCLS